MTCGFEEHSPNLRVRSRFLSHSRLLVGLRIGENLIAYAVYLPGAGGPLSRSIKAMPWECKGLHISRYPK
jgi:hypothetical protein